MTIGMGLQENDFAAMVRKNAFVKLYIAPSSRAGRFTIRGLLRRAQVNNEERLVTLSSRREFERTWVHLPTLMTFAKHRLGANRLEIDLDNLDP